MRFVLAAKAAALGAVLICTAPFAFAGEIILTSLDETSRVQGAFVAFEDGVYVLMIDGQLVRVAAGVAACAGEDCVVGLS